MKTASRSANQKPTGTVVPPWEESLRKNLPLYGHRNWVVVADSAYPSQSRQGIETIVADEDQQLLLVGEQGQPDGGPVQPAACEAGVGQELGGDELGAVSQVSQLPFPQDLACPGPAAAGRGGQRAQVQRRVQRPGLRSWLWLI